MCFVWPDIVEDEFHFLCQWTEEIFVWEGSGEESWLTLDVWMWYVELVFQGCPSKRFIEKAENTESYVRLQFTSIDLYNLNKICFYTFV